MLTSWPVLVGADRGARAAGLARGIAEKLRPCAAVREVAERSARVRSMASGTTGLQAAGQQRAKPHAHDLAQGEAGIALLHGWMDRCFPEERWDIAAHAHLARAAESVADLLESGPGLFAGAAGLAYTAHYLSRHGERYRRMLSSVEAVLLPEITAAASALGARRDGVPVHSYDVITGLAGAAAYLLSRRDDAAASEALGAVVQALVSLSEEDAVGPRWRTPYEMLDPFMQKVFRSGNINCGLAHGVPGPLAAMAIAYYLDVRVDRLPEAITRVADWLLRQRISDAWGPAWPYAVPLDPADASAHPHARNAWCYGSPGVARALWLAGDALGERRYRDAAIEAIAAVIRRPVAGRGIDGSTFCHGVAGLLQIVLRFAHDAGTPELVGAACTLCDQLLALHEPESLLGYRNIEADGSQNDLPWLLEGAAGVAMTLLAAGGGVEPTWDRIFLLS
jgi:lantibiotic biosynthesis protein